jgi:hypothetical protein
VCNLGIYLSGKGWSDFFIKAKTIIYSSVNHLKNEIMAKYSKAAQEKVGEEMHEMKEGKLRSGSGKKVTNPKQAIAIGLSEARKEGKKVPPPPKKK